jgi:hypothetical protein
MATKVPAPTDADGKMLRKRLLRAFWKMTAAETVMLGSFLGAITICFSELTKRSPASGGLLSLPLFQGISFPLPQGISPIAAAASLGGLGIILNMTLVLLSERRHQALTAANIAYHTAKENIDGSRNAELAAFVFNHVDNVGLPAFDDPAKAARQIAATVANAPGKTQPCTPNDDPVYAACNAYTAKANKSERRRRFVAAAALVCGGAACAYAGFVLDNPAVAIWALLGGSLGWVASHIAAVHANDKHHTVAAARTAYFMVKNNKDGADSARIGAFMQKHLPQVPYPDLRDPDRAAQAIFEAAVPAKARKAMLAAPKP